MLDIVLVLTRNEFLESPSDPFVGVHLLGLLFVVHGNPMVVLEVTLELVDFLELFEEKLVSEADPYSDGSWGPCPQAPIAPGKSRFFGR